MIDPRRSYRARDEAKVTTIVWFDESPEALISTFRERWVNLGVVFDMYSQVKIYSVADVFVLLFREDNLPNMMLESLSCGSPVISFSTPGA